MGYDSVSQQHFSIIFFLLRKCILSKSSIDMGTVYRLWNYIWHVPCATFAFCNSVVLFIPKMKDAFLHKDTSSTAFVL